MYKRISKSLYYLAHLKCYCPGHHFIFAIPLIVLLPNLAFLLLIIVLVNNAGCIVSGQADNAEFEISVSAETAEEGGKREVFFFGF
uniref:Uncharacterized protein n=1 Tax=Candidatus Methanophaga sp. ANME-1 ERB7 TaxID=2759913 RepID=A0A7G9ZA65_9EURY|nr:hypothetical protein BDIJAAHH_00022 [Methanosarcinales archaeon ANME-1 ERB7]